MTAPLTLEECKRRDELQLVLRQVAAETPIQDSRSDLRKALEAVK
jgi:hypothetical protein